MATWSQRAKIKKESQAALEKYRPDHSYSVPLPQIKDRYVFSTYSHTDTNYETLTKALGQHDKNFVGSQQKQYIGRTKSSYVNFDWMHNQHFIEGDKSTQGNTNESSLSASMQESDVTVDWQALPRDVFLFIVEKLVPLEIVRLARTCRKWRGICTENAVWKPRVIERWPTTNPNINMKSWYNYYRSRHDVVEKFKAQGRGMIPHPIENCNWEFKCPVAWENLDVLERNSTSYCRVCSEVVWYVDEVEEFNAHTKMGHCVAVGGFGYPSGVRGKPALIPQ